ncbi:MAG: DUF4065 domain-containing protein [Bacteroidales bacterium]|nr:DUF4065 domain-containing protein [Bacteroidales bacterium]
MKSPYTGKEMQVQRERRTMSFRKEEFKVIFHSYQCDDTEEKFEDAAFAQLNYNLLLNQYREKYSILFPEQIIELRRKYSLSALKMSEILGFGANSYRQYEAGDVPNQSNSRLIHLANDPREFIRLVDLSITLDDKTRSKLVQRIGSLIDEQRSRRLESQLEKYFFGASLPNSLNGFRVPSLARFTEMVVFFTERLQPWKTKLNKLLFYADFSMFQKTGFSISGFQYRAIPMGPVPNNFNSIFEFLANNNEVDIWSTQFEDGGTGEQFMLARDRKFNAELFANDELRTLEAIADRFKTISTNEIIDLSHKEKAWIDNEVKKKIIDYSYSFYLN